MNAKIFETLEFSKIKHQVANHVQTELAKEKVEGMFPSDDSTTVTTWQDETEESLAILDQDQVMPIPRINQLKGALKRLELGASLNGKEIAEIGKLLSSIGQVGQFFETLAEDDRFYPALQVWVDQAIPLPEIVKLIDNAIDPDGNVRTSASSKLVQIRKDQQQTEQQVRNQLNQMLKSRSNQLSDSLITIRNNRYVLPVKAEYRNAVGGTVHDQSSTGQTLYIEPPAVVKLNNRRSELQVAEKNEIERILLEISGQLMPYYDEIAHNQDIISQLDYIQGRGELARQMKAVKPSFSDNQEVSIWQARHPLIDPDDIVTNDIILGNSYRALIITGPNTGGKTILLKTLGLLQLMGQSGLHIPAEKGSQLGLFDQIFADIGDEQSIEQSLSTFSSHMTNTVRILNQATHESLLLFDELGSGTDPQEGSALAIAILDFLNKQDITVMATTHYPELKVYAHEAPKTINASMEFDSETLSPTYRLLIGIPGRSNAFDISQRLGLPSEILANAREGVSQESHSLNEMVANLERQRREIETDKEATESKLNDAEQLLGDLRTEYDRWLEQKDKIVSKTKREANEKVAEIQKEADSLIQEIRELQLEQGQNATIKEHVLIDKKNAFDNLKQPEHLKGNKVLKRAKEKQALKPGDDVEVTTYGQRGTIIEKVDKDTFTVQLGILKMNVDAKDLVPIDKVDKPKSRVNVQRNVSSKVKTTLDLRGKRYNDALGELNQYLDQAILSNHPMVTVIHGKGTGAIREGVQKSLKKHSQVDRFNYSPPNAGGNGSTQVYFK